MRCREHAGSQASGTLQRPAAFSTIPHAWRSLDLSRQLHKGLSGVGVLNAAGFLATDRVQAFAASGKLATGAAVSHSLHPPAWEQLQAIVCTHLPAASLPECCQLAPPAPGKARHTPC